ncbi:hypothetical protein NA57DRAFT_56748 [Rhizodiscina lignyota]|uniref:PH domain-containing protein n=1 Tax=Rhizodiscina lignyota TaxID=1504668 RepID=A0A9P4IC32_9PEZI|nr:hypothetical protein NA57DRAFT_56748 [Rhizodiscina lignyota]
MSFQVSLGDIVKALEICHWIHRNCFNPINNASVLYVGFRDDVLQLENRIKQFQASFENAFQQLASMDLARLDMLKLESDELIGDYLTTLKECKQLLQKHAKFNGDRATALDNAFWHARSQPRVEELRKQLQSHSYKIYLFLEPVRLELVTNISADTQEILTLLRQQSGITNSTQLPEIPPSMDAALRAALFRDYPVPFDEARNIPLRESIDALFLHFRDCTVGSTSSGIGPDIKQNLGLLKAHWLFQTIESSASLSQSRQGSLYRRVHEQLGQRIEKQYKSLKIQRWAEEDFEALDDVAWAIWPIKELPKPDVMTDRNDREEKLAEVPLVCRYPDQKEDLYIFRVSESTLRIVRTRNLKSQSVGLQMTERFLDLDCDGLVPFYAVAPPIGDCYTLNMTNGKGGGSVSYDFPSRKTALRVQTAFTGYHTISVTTGITCTVTWRRTSRINRSDQEKAAGEVQIWQWPVPKPPSGQSTNLHSPSEPSSSSLSNSIYSKSGQSSIAHQTFQAFDPNVVSITGVGGGGEMMIAELPPAPVLVFLVQRESKYTMWHLELLQVELKKNLRHSKKYRTILERPTGKIFPLRRLAVNESQLDFWNIRSIAVPPRSKDKGKPAVENLDGTSVVLDFATEQEQTTFEAYFKHTALQRMKQIKQFNLGRNVALSQSDMPSRRASYVPATIYGESASASTITPIPERKETGVPILNPIPTFPSLHNI